MKKPILAILVVVVVIGVAAVGGAYYWRNAIVEAAIERGGTYALGVDTTLGSANLDFGGGSLTIKRLRVANPQGFETPTFIELDRGYLSVETGSLLDDQVEVPELTIEGVRLTIDKHEGKANYEHILENVQRFEQGETSEEVEEPASTKRLVVRKIVIKDIQVSASLLPIGGDLAHTDFEVDEIVLADIGTDHPQGLTLADLSAILTKAILSASLKAGGNLLPGELQKGLTSALGGVGAVGDITVDFSKVVGGETGKVLEDAASKVLDGADKKVGGALKGLTKGLLGEKK